MRIEFNRTGTERKEMVKALASIIGEDAKYLGAPSMAYQIGKFTVTRDGALEFDEFDFPTGIDQILQDLERSGIEPEQTEDEVMELPEGDTLTVEMPREQYPDETLENLKRIIESKGILMRHAFGTDDLPITVTDEKVSFPWFSSIKPDAVKAYTHFISAITDMAKNQKRITAKEKEVDNEKYAFRCFLLRLGFIGAEYKDERKILLQNLSGSSAFKSGQKGGAEA